MQLFNSILRIGTDEKQSELTNFSVILTNSIALISAAVNFFYMLLFLTKVYFPCIIFFSAGCILSVSCIYLNSIYKRNLSSSLLFIYTGLIILISSFLFGYDTQCHTLLVIISMCTVLTSKNLYFPILYNISIFLIFCLSYLYTIDQGPIVPELKILYSEFVNFGFALLAAVVFAIVILKEVVDYINSLKSTLTELKSKNEEIKKQNRKLELFNTVAAHDLRTPVRNINSFISLAKQKLNSKSERLKVDECLDTAQNSALQMNELINSISQMSALNKNNLVEQEIVNAEELVEDVIKQAIHPLYPTAKIQYGSLPLVYLNRADLQTIFQNLFLNGFKYNKHNNKLINIDVTYDDSSCKLLIRDNGIGIESDYLKKIFEPFARLHSDSEFEGSGMGLFIVREILHKYNATICVEDSSKDGTSFAISLPMKMIIQPKVLDLEI